MSGHVDVPGGLASQMASHWFLRLELKSLSFKSHLDMICYSQVSPSVALFSLFNTYSDNYYYYHFLIENILISVEVE